MNIEELGEESNWGTDAVFVALGKSVSRCPDDDVRRSDKEWMELKSSRGGGYTAYQFPKQEALSIFIR
jgi:hypothetical protein